MHLHLTQPAVSQALRRLEDRLGMRLVDRHGPRIEVTQAGIEVQKPQVSVMPKASIRSTPRSDAARAYAQATLSCLAMPPRG